MRNLLHIKPRRERWYHRDDRIRAGKKKTWISVLIIIGILICIELALYAINANAESDKILQSIPHRVMVLSAQTSPTPTPELTHRQIIEQAKHSDIILRIWNNETSQGKATDPTGINVICSKKHTTNEFGYDPFGKKCFKTFKDSVDTVDKWFDSCLDNNTLQECLEKYSGNSKLYISSFLNQ